MAAARSDSHERAFGGTTVCIDIRGTLAIVPGHKAK